MIKTEVYLGVGSNLGDRRQNIKTAVEKLRKLKSTRVIETSYLTETEPVGGPAQNNFLNGAIKIETGLKPHQLLAELKKIEKSLGRIKTVKNGPRPIDLDILLYGDERIDTSDLKIPHPRMHEREFVMQPLKELQK